MQIHQLKPIHKSKKRKRVARGGKRGTYSGRGQKGQKSRAGRKLEPFIRGLIKKYPKLRGYKFKGLANNIAIVNIFDLEKKFEKSEIVSPKSLLSKRLIRRINGKTPKVKILGEGETKKALTVIGCQASKQAKEKIEKAGGAIK